MGPAKAWPQVWTVHDRFRTVVVVRYLWVVVARPADPAARHRWSTAAAAAAATAS